MTNTYPLITDVNFDTPVITGRLAFVVVKYEGQQVGDILRLIRTTDTHDRMTQETPYYYEITIIDRYAFGLKKGWCVLGFKPFIRVIRGGVEE